MSTNVFISYTMRDGEISHQTLQHYVDILSPQCDVYVDCLYDHHRRHPQLTIIRRIVGAHLVLVLVSRSVYKSPWVLFEIAVAKLLFKPIARIKVANASR